jgi:hypothetical protein
MGKYLNRNQILTCNDTKTEEVTVPEWGGIVLVKALNGKERDAYEQSMYIIDGGNFSVNKDNIRAKLVAKTICDEDLKPVFTEGDIEILGEKNGAALDKVFAVAQKLCGMGGQTMEMLEKNLTPTTLDTSASS